MSRCFPFPPPGYEAKLRSEHKDLLKKEKHKEKKHRKERKHREKRERKEKDRDHKKDEHNKKHKREKHRDRRKNKDSDEDKKQTLEQETQKNDDLGNRRPKERVQNEVVNDIKPTDDLFTPILGQVGHANHSGSSTSKLLPRRTESFGVAGSKEKERTSLSGVVETYERTTQRNHASEKGKDTDHGSKTRIQNGKSLQVGSAEKHSTRKYSSNGVGLQQERFFAQRSCEGVASTTVIPGGGRGLNGRITPSPNVLQRTEQVGQLPDSSSYSAYGKSDSMRTKGMMEKENGSANKFHTRTDQQLVRRKDGQIQGKAKVKEVKANHHKGVKERDRDHNLKKRKAKDKNKEREKEKKGDVNDQQHKELDAHGASKNNIDLVDSARLNEKNFTSDDVKKRKDLGANSSLHEHSMRMTKLPRMSPASPVSVNGETLKHSQATAPCFSTVPVGTNTCEADCLQQSKECYSNGITGSHSLEENKASVSSIGYDSNEASLKPPHPDTKYLNKLYSIPAVDDCSGYIGQDWLFSGDRVDQKTVISDTAESPCVWAEAQLIDSADIVALPYVVPL